MHDFAVSKFTFNLYVKHRPTIHQQRNLEKSVSNRRNLRYKFTNKRHWYFWDHPLCLHNAICILINLGPLMSRWYEWIYFRYPGILRNVGRHLNILITDRHALQKCRQETTHGHCATLQTIVDPLHCSKILNSHIN